MKLRHLGILLITFLLVVATACSKDDNNNDENEPETEENENNNEEENEDENNNNNENEEENENENDSNESADGDLMNPGLEETGGDIEVIYTNENPDYENDLDGLIVTINKYQIVNVTDMNQSEDIAFSEDLEGYAVTADVTVDNTTDDDLYYTHAMQIRTDDRYDYIPGNANKYIPEENELTFDDPDDRAFKAGESVDFFTTFVMTNEEYEDVQSSDPKFVIEGGVSTNDDFSGSYGEEEVFPFIYGDDQAEDVASSDDFIEDKITTENIATKELIYEDMDLNQTEEIDGAKVTLESIQYTELDIKDESKERFSSFDGDDLVAISIDVEVDNQSDEMISNDGFSSTLFVNGDEVRILSQGSLENDSGREIEPGDTGSRQLVYLFAEKYYDIYEEFDIEMGPFFGEDGYLFKEKTLEFDLPRE